MTTIRKILIPAFALAMAGCKGGGSNTATAEDPSNDIQTNNQTRVEKDNKLVLVISSSPRKGGNSDLLCDEFIRGAQEAGHTVEKIFLNDYDIKFYTNTDYTRLNLPEAELDDAGRIANKMVDADVIVMATPVYFYSMSGQMKTMIDRTFDRDREINDKEFYFIITSADRDMDDLQPVADGFRGFLKCIKNPIERGMLFATGVTKAGAVAETPFMEQAFKMGKGV